jgi:glycosyltransferase involved in cell wall biosynthesis
MIKALFVHSHRFTVVDDVVYSSDSFPHTVWDRYLEHFDEIVVLGRKDLSLGRDIANYSISSRERVSFKLLEYLEPPLNSYILKSKIKKDIKNIIKKHNISAIIARLPSELSYRAIDVCRELHIPYAVEVVGCAFDAVYNYKFNPWYNIKNLGVKILAPFSYRSMKHYVNGAPYALYVTKNFLQNRYPSTTGAYTTGVSDVNIPEMDYKVLENHISYLNRQNREIMFGMIGNTDVYYKGFDITLKALSLVKEQIPNFKLYLVGGGSGKAVRNLAIKLDLIDNIVFVGKIRSGVEIFKFLDNLDIYLHPSRTEGMPRALIEAMARACPCLASSVGGIPELLDRKYLFKKEDYKSLSELILQLINSKEALVNASKDNFDIAKNYTLTVLSKRRMKFWGTFYSYVEKNN